MTAADSYINSIAGSGFFVGVKMLSGSFKWIDGTPFNPTGVTPDSWCSSFTDPNGDCVFVNTQTYDASTSCYDRFDCNTVPSMVFATCQMDRKRSQCKYKLKVNIGVLILQWIMSIQFVCRMVGTQRLSEIVMQLHLRSHSHFSQKMQILFLLFRMAPAGFK